MLRCVHARAFVCQTHDVTHQGQQFNVVEFWLNVATLTKPPNHSAETAWSSTRACFCLWQHATVWLCPGLHPAIADEGDHPGRWAGTVLSLCRALHGVLFCMSSLFLVSMNFTRLVTLV